MRDVVFRLLYVVKYQLLHGTRMLSVGPSFLA
jgi:hypothetical protein